MATATITPDQTAVHAEIFIAAPPERVFAAISDPEQLPRWWGQSGMYRITERRSDPRPGGTFRSEGVSADGTKFYVEGEYIEIDPPRRIVHTWVSSYMEGKSTVYWDLEPHTVHGLHPSGPKKAGTGTLVKLRHEGFAANDPKGAASHGDGWKRVFGWLQAYLERGETIDTRK